MSKHGRHLLRSAVSPLACSQIPQDGLVASYLLQGTAEDETGTYNGSENGCTYAYDDERGVVFTPTSLSQYINLGGTLFDNLGDFSISIQVYHTSTTNAFVFGDGGGENSIKFTDDDLGAMRFFIEGNVYIDAVYTLNQWTHYLIVRSGSTLTIRQNDVETLNTTCVTTTIVVTADTLLGANNINTYLSGKLSNFHIYNRALTAQEQTDIYNIEKYQHNNALDHGLIAYYPLDGNSLDNAINQYDGTDTSVSYVADGTFGTVLDCGAGNVGLPTATGHVRTYYWENTGSGWVHNNTATEITSLTTNKYAHVRKYNRTLSTKELSILQDIEKNLLCHESKTIDNPDPFEDGSGIALYKLDGNANDTTGVYDGTPTSITYADGEFGQSAVFDGTNSRIEVNSLFPTVPTTDLSFSIWVKGQVLVNTSATNQSIFVFYRNSYIFLDVKSSQLRFTIREVDLTDREVVAPITEFDTTNWYHLTATIENGVAIKLYINGVFYGSDVKGVGYYDQNGVNDFIGANGANSTIVNYANGSFDQVRIFNRALTADEVTKLYNERKV